MNLIIFSFLYYTVFVVNFANAVKCNNGLYIDEVYHEKVVLISGLQRVYYPNIDFETNTLFYSSAGEHPSYGSIFTAHRTARLDLKTLQTQEIRGENDAYCNTLDRSNHIIYSATTHGIYAFNFVNGTRYDYYGANTTIGTVQFTNGTLYYTAPAIINHSPVYKLYKFNENRDSSLVEELEDSIVDKFIIDNDGDITFSNNSGIYIWKKRESKSYSYFDYSNNLRSFNIDIYGNVFVCFDLGIYKTDKLALKMKLYLQPYPRVPRSQRFSGLTFDQDNNLIYANAYSIVKLVPNSECKKPVEHDKIWFSWDNLQGVW